MRNLMGLLKLDIKLVTPYWKWLVLFFGIALLMGILNNNDAGSIFMFSFAIFAGTCTAFPFENTDKSNLNVLFATLPTNRRSMLVARHIFFLVTLVIMLVAGIIVGIVLDLIMGNELSFTVMSLFACLAIGLYLFNVGFQTPFFYRYGYTKGRIFLWIPIIVVMVIVQLPQILGAFGIEDGFNIFEVMFRNTTLTSFIAVGIGIVSIVVSFFFSRKVYLNKDF